MSKDFLELGLQNPKPSTSRATAALTAQKKASPASVLSGYTPANPESGRRHSCTSAPLLVRRKRRDKRFFDPVVVPELPLDMWTSSVRTTARSCPTKLGSCQRQSWKLPVSLPSGNSAFGPVLARRHRREDAGQLATRCWPPAAVVETHLYRRVDGSFNDNGTVDDVGRNKQHTGPSRPSEPATSQSQTVSAFRYAAARFLCQSSLVGGVSRGQEPHASSRAQARLRYDAQSSRPPLHCPPFEPVRSAELHSEHIESSGLAPATSESRAREHGRLWTRTVRVDRLGPAAMANVEGRHVRLARHLVVAFPRTDRTQPWAKGIETRAAK
ncbi:hypothetical protein CSOJ01_09042 [Colletotrichum sojae]|uniref:Uncharacterized protein n=1 Tax=Colletotrichum sojae TaxID=2175907 RepID=A0A8H6J3Z6_9PEZI|nr:hypothetical protein CSOJ01_09042 [Colletotrichum sojae]